MQNSLMFQSGDRVLTEKPVSGYFSSLLSLSTLNLALSGVKGLMLDFSVLLAVEVRTNYWEVHPHFQEQMTKQHKGLQ